MQNIKLEEYPIEQYYLLESKEFLDTREKIYLKQNNSFKLNSYYLGVSNRRINNDKIIYLFNGIRGYYDVKSRFIKNPFIMETRPPISKPIYNFIYMTRKYKPQDLIIYSLRLFGRPSVSLMRDDQSGNESYIFPYKLVQYLNSARRNRLNSDNYNIYKSNYFFNFSLVSLRMWVNIRRYNKRSLRRLKLAPSLILGFYSSFYLNYFCYLAVKQQEAKRSLRKFVSLKKNNINGIFRRIKRSLKKNFRKKQITKMDAFLLFNNNNNNNSKKYKNTWIRYRRGIRYRRKFYRAKKFLQLLLLKKKKINFRLKLNQIRSVTGIRIPKFKKLRVVVKAKIIRKNKRKLKNVYKYCRRVVKNKKFQLKLSDNKSNGFMFLLNKKMKTKKTKVLNKKNKGGKNYRIRGFNKNIVGIINKKKSSNKFNLSKKRHKFVRWVKKTSNFKK